MSWESSMATEHKQARTAIFFMERYLCDNNGTKMPKGINNIILPTIFWKLSEKKLCSECISNKPVTIFTTGIIFMPFPFDSLNLLNGKGKIVRDIVPII